MAKLNLDAKSVEAILKPALQNHVSAAAAGVEGDKAFVAVTRMMTFKFKLTCNDTAQNNKVTVHLVSPFGSGVVLSLARGVIQQQAPFVEKLESDVCILDLTKILVGDKKLTDWIKVNAIKIPGENGAFATVEFQVKSQ